jgi:pyroglutamyl-peptidase
MPVFGKDHAQSKMLESFDNSNKTKKALAMRVLITGFGPFPGAPYNPSGVLAKRLAHSHRPALAGIKISAHVFATAYAAVDRDLTKLFAAKPDIVLLFGVAGRRRQVCVETRARNTASLIFPDADRAKPERDVIELRGPAALRGRAPFMPLLHALKQNQVPSRLSRDAGSYLCNYVYWRALQRTSGGTRVQFVHIPSAARISRERLLRGAQALLIALIAAKRR